MTSRLIQDLSQLRSRLPSHDPDGSSKASTSKNSSDTEHSNDAATVELKNIENRNTQDNGVGKLMQDGECQTEKAHLVSTEIKELISALKTKSAKWKQKCKALGTALLKLKTVMATRETLLKVKHMYLCTNDTDYDIRRSSHWQKLKRVKHTKNIRYKYNV